MVQHKSVSPWNSASTALGLSCESGSGFIGSQALKQARLLPRFRRWRGNPEEASGRSAAGNVHDDASAVDDDASPVNDADPVGCPGQQGQV